MAIAGMNAGEFDVEFWDTVAGKPVRRLRTDVGEDGVLRVDVPDFARDLAFKVKRPAVEP
jgi:hypothetical protein